MADPKQNRDFAPVVMVQYPLDEAIEWIKSNLYPEEVFEASQLNEWAADHYECPKEHKEE